jgi:hypothetical protein
MLSRPDPPQRAAEPGGHRIAAESIGCRVARSSGGGRVAAVFARACNLAMDDGALVTVLAGKVGRVAHGIRLPGALPRYPGLRAGTPVHLDARRLVFSAVPFEVTLPAARIWTPDLRMGMCDRTGAAREAALLARNLLSGAAAQSPSECLATVLRSDHPPTLSATRLAAVFRQLAPATRARDAAAALGAVAQLVGLGPGLTPAGDDIIIGWLAGLTLTATMPGQQTFLRAVGSGIRGLRSATTAVSSQHLDDACALMFSEHLSDLCVAIATGAPAPALAARVAAQLEVGATSGADAAAGLMFALFHCGSIDR